MTTFNIVLLALVVNLPFLAFAIGFNYGADRTGELKKFNESKNRYLAGVLK